MSKSRSRKWYDYEDEDYSKKDKRFRQRRENKKIKNALKSKNLEYLEDVEKD